MQATPSNLVRERQSSGEIAILAAAVRLFSKHGYDGVSMRQIAEEAGVSKANIYHHFNSKEALYLAIIRESSGKLLILIESLAEGDGAIDERLLAFASAHIEHLFENATKVRLVLREAFSGDEEKSRLLAVQVVGEIFRRISAIFRSGQESGLLRADLDPGLCAMMLMSSDLMYFQSRNVLKHIPEAEFAREPGEFSRQMTDVILNGMLAVPRSKEAGS
jgi:TetR/AcrR family transcriptional regulator